MLSRFSPRASLALRQRPSSSLLRPSAVYLGRHVRSATTKKSRQASSLAALFNPTEVRGLFQFKLRRMIIMVS